GETTHDQRDGGSVRHRPGPADAAGGDADVFVGDLLDGRADGQQYQRRSVRGDRDGGDSVLVLLAQSRQRRAAADRYHADDDHADGDHHGDRGRAEGVMVLGYAP